MKKYIGNIIANPNFKVEGCFKKCFNLTDIDDSLPTLIIGLQNAKKYINNFNILINRYNDNMLWWTFSKTERRIDHDRDVNEFYKFCIKNITNNIKYYYINYNNLTYNKAKRCINYIKNNNRKYYYIDNDKFIFIYDVEDKNKENIFGFSLTTSEFFGTSKKKIISLLENNKQNIEIKNFWSLPNKTKNIVDDDIPSKMVLLEYF